MPWGPGGFCRVPGRCLGGSSPKGKGSVLSCRGGGGGRRRDSTARRVPCPHKLPTLLSQSWSGRMSSSAVRNVSAQDRKKPGPEIQDALGETAESGRSGRAAYAETREKQESTERVGSQAFKHLTAVRGGRSLIQVLIRRDTEPKMLLSPVQPFPLPVTLGKKLPPSVLFCSPTPQGYLAAAVRFQLGSTEPRFSAPSPAGCALPSSAGLMPRDVLAQEQVGAVGTQKYVKRG